MTPAGASRRPPGTLPLSGMQHAMWRAYAGRARAGADVEQLIVSFDEPVRLDRLQEAWNLVFANTPVLRARFVWDRDGEPGQVFDAAAPPEWNELDASGLPPQQREILWRQATDEDRRKGFDLRHGPLSRFCWVRWGPESTQIAWTFHHILLDGRSIPLVVEDVFTAYAALELGQVPRLPDRSGFEAFLLRRESWWGERAEEAEAFWTDAFRDRGEPAPLAMDTAPAAHGQLGESAAAPFQLSPSLGAALRERAAALGVGLSTLIHAAWGLLLCTHSGRPEVVFSVINAGRRGIMEGLDSVPGMFLTSPPVRFAFDPSARLGSLLGALRARSLAARPFEHAPPAPSRPLDGRRGGPGRLRVGGRV